MPRYNMLDFQKSITKELFLLKDRVECIIGDANWGDVGRYKEALLRRVVSQYLPANLAIGTGFIVDNRDYLFGRDGRTSSQMDIIIYQSNYPLVFKEGDFVIVTEEAVRAVIEVKTRIVNYVNDGARGNDNALNKIIEKINKLNDFETFNLSTNNRKKFVGIFAYDYDQDFSVNRVDEALLRSNGLVNHISLGPNKFIKYWDNTYAQYPMRNLHSRCYIRYNLSDLSFSYFISNLLHMVADEEPKDRYWFSFPVEGTKEVHRAEHNPVIELP